MESLSAPYRANPAVLKERDEFIDSIASKRTLNSKFAYDLLSTSNSVEQLKRKDFSERTVGKKPMELRKAVLIKNFLIDLSQKYA